MYDLIVLGLVPGTNIQITFELFMVVVLIIVTALLLIFEFRHYTLMVRINKRILSLGILTRKSFFNWQNTLPPKLQLFK